MRNVVLRNRPRRTRLASAFTSSGIRSIMRLSSYASLTRASTATTPSPFGLTISGLTSASATAGPSAMRELRQRHQRVGQGVEIARRLAAIARERFQRRDFADHGSWLRRDRPARAAGSGRGGFRQGCRPPRASPAGRRRHRRDSRSRPRRGPTSSAAPARDRHWSLAGFSRWPRQRVVVLAHSSTTPPTSDLCAIFSDSALTTTG